MRLVSYLLSHTEKHARNVVIPTPSHNVFMLLTKEEANRFHEILEAADTEAKAQQLLAMFQE